jgi:hypothetical protein
MPAEDETGAAPAADEQSAQPRNPARRSRSRWLMIAALLVAAMFSVWRCG